jgi:hypothetical protein
MTPPRRIDMSKKAQKARELTNARDTLPYPWPTDGEGFTPNQVVATAEHVLAISDWVHADRALILASGLLDLVDEELIEVEDDGKTVRVGTDKDAARYAVLAARLITAYGLLLDEIPVLS